MLIGGDISLSTDSTTLSPKGSFRQTDGAFPKMLDHIVLLGDSVTVGTGFSGVDEDTRYVAVLDRYLAKRRREDLFRAQREQVKELIEARRRLYPPWWLRLYLAFCAKRIRRERPM